SRAPRRGPRAIGGARPRRRSGRGTRTVTPPARPRVTTEPQRATLVGTPSPKEPRSSSGGLSLARPAVRSLGPAMLIDSFRALGRGACAAAIVGGALASCGEVLSLEISPPTADADAGVPADLPPCDPGESPGEGVFVSAAFGLPGGLGTRETPLRSIQDALEAAAAKGLSRVFVDEGTYEESLTLTDRHAGVVV